VTVDVAGKVRHPGIAVLDAGSRVVDALEAAGGAKAGVDLAGLNLARVLVDGEQVVVGERPPGGVGASATPPPGPPSGGGPATLVNLNTATEAELDTLPDVGPVTAASILAWRDQHGGFTSVDELLEVDGIGEVTLGKLAPLVTV
jgi:competence protein ComEA